MPILDVRFPLQRNWGTGESYHTSRRPPGQGSFECQDLTLIFVRGEQVKHVASMNRRGRGPQISTVLLVTPSGATLERRQQTGRQKQREDREKMQAEALSSWLERSSSSVSSEESRGGPSLDWVDKLRLVRDVARALEALHSRGVTHG
jgi:hypothetical protein